MASWEDAWVTSDTSWGQAISSWNCFGATWQPAQMQTQTQTQYQVQVHLNLYQQQQQWQLMYMHQMQVQNAQWLHDQIHPKQQMPGSFQSHFARLWNVDPTTTVEELVVVLAGIDFEPTKIQKGPDPGSFEIEFPEIYTAKSFYFALDKVDPKRKVLVPAAGKEIRVAILDLRKRERGRASK